MSISEKIASVLAQKGLRQKDLGEKIGVARSTINNWLSLNRDIPAQYVIPISEFLGISVFDLLGQAEKASSSFSKPSKDEAEALALYKRLGKESRIVAKGKMIELYNDELAKKEGAASSVERVTS